MGAAEFSFPPRRLVHLTCELPASLASWIEAEAEGLHLAPADVAAVLLVIGSSAVRESRLRRQSLPAGGISNTPRNVSN